MGVFVRMNVVSYRLRTWLTTMDYRTAVKFGLVATVLLSLVSYAVGATRTRGGIVQELGLQAITFGHFNGLIIPFLWIALALWCVSWVVIGGHIIHHGATITRGAWAAWVLPLFFAGPLMSRDIYSYLMQGTLARDGINAYDSGAAANPGQLLFEVSADWRNTTTPYGPGHLGIGKVITSVTGENVTAGIFIFKALAILSVAVMAWAVHELARCFSALPTAPADLNPQLAVWIGVANPLVILHLVGGLHNENMMMALVLCGLLAAMRLRPVPGAMLGAVLIACAVSLKITAAFALPFMVWISVARIAGDAPLRLRDNRDRLLSWIFKDTWRRFFTALGVGMSVVAVTLGVLALITVVSGQTWGWIAEITGNSKVINPLAMPSLISAVLEPVLSYENDAVTFNSILSVARPLSSAMMIGCFFLTWWLSRHTVHAALVGMTIAYMFTTIFNTVTLPWYYAAPLALCGVWAASWRRHKTLLLSVAVASMWLCFMFDGGGNNRLYVTWWVVSIAVAMYLLTTTPLRHDPVGDRWRSVRTLRQRRQRCSATSMKDKLPR